MLFPRYSLPVLAACFLLACSPRAYVVSRVADAVSSGGDSFARDDDPELVREAVPFALKSMESLLDSQPDHKGLLAALCRGFTQYAAAFVRQDAEGGLAIATSPDDPGLLAGLPRGEALMRRALALNEGYDGGAIHEYFIAFEGGRPEAMGGSAEKARRDFERAMALSGGKKVSPLVTFAETVSVRTQNRKEFLDLLDRALAFDARAGAPEHRVVNLVSQRRARWLKGRVDERFID